MRIRLSLDGRTAQWCEHEGFSGDPEVVDAAQSACAVGTRVSVAGALVEANDDDALGAWAALAALDPSSAVLEWTDDEAALAALLEEF
ncbi:MAG: hypothetical protein E6640_01655 [Actinomyces urogenitalis]|uniref:hypothetical protein n=1 Tax=Actinomyces urogenitalis TaxID=103621 RepID=UPI00290D0536|nr:hypothetical protein [Actinomyces urogenitalis]MDU6150916.1 hypothetical protein [Actinomyces urogenitalis]